ncbi:hypothetical protein [Salisediminibacterium halotolerans]|uniref:hypothetical protein n=1 Tax=Salisediminibacterium halotolerans TaxID=517425 RepID=UPI000EACC72A|nr:hypothetical protein [Salisediminibacterium halotolerans]RLJ74482.1 hypothetical protein BCL39_1772 [Actinophytocola xinjiangensis]RPE87425.1 hypothetical protein EDD67_1159 [Salisediminibacterium halotolerans]TWG35318.1 hypothetical protein BCL52_1769 [Salisediminibacterium halotolerans]GEL07950.1 hypothetical protein SHA02_13660 [Salisediminibacterium halotolerans]
MKLPLPFSIFTILLAGCIFAEDTNEENESASLPVQNEIEQEPLKLSYEGFDQSSEALTLGFKAEHQDESAIAADDYQFQWPSYITDENDLYFKLSETNISNSRLFTKELRDDQLGITLDITPPPSNNRSSFFLIPFYMIPSLFEDGYQFTLDHDKDKIVLGDLAVEDYAIKNRQLSFMFQDDHPDAKREQEYLFTIIEENTEIYPQFSSVEQLNGGRLAELEFAGELEFPLDLAIERTSANLPEWRFSFVIELEKGEDFSS